MPDVLIHGDTVRSPELRHQLPLAIPDPFLYVERDGSRHAVLTAFEIARLEELAIDVEPHPLEEFGLDELVGTGLRSHEVFLEVFARACRALGIERAAVPPSFPLALADRLRADGIEVEADEELFVARRRVKTPRELEGIRRAQAAAEVGMAAAAAMLARARGANGVLRLDGEPLTSERIRREIERVFGEHDATADQVIVAPGPQGAVGHEEGSGAIAPGEPVVIDLFPYDKASGCYADMTRTFVVGDVSDELDTYFRLCREALELALGAIRPGVEGRELHRLVCELFHEHGYPTQLSKEPGTVLRDGFFHGLGHGVGLEVHEEPGLGRTGVALVAGDVVAVEPGLYRHDYGGVRLEDLVRVTDDGAEKLTDFPYDLEPGRAGGVAG
ncbi:MAG: aminopeptidase P family protein [Thermoleophilia bacterium]|nr:aminopeptidase P family protein [Thermoleophilia bacterium]